MFGRGWFGFLLACVLGYSETEGILPQRSKIKPWRYAPYAGRCRIWDGITNYTMMCPTSGMNSQHPSVYLVLWRKARIK